MEPNCTCLLLTILLLPIIIWLAEMLTLLRKKSTAVFQDSAQREHTIGEAQAVICVSPQSYYNRSS